MISYTFPRCSKLFSLNVRVLDRDSHIYIHVNYNLLGK